MNFNMSNKECKNVTSGGKGNLGKFTERDSKVIAAGLPSAQAYEGVSDALQHYLLKDASDALLSDAIIPPPEPRPLPPLRYPIPKDQRHACPHSQVEELINPPIKTKFQTLVDDFKETSFNSYWKKPLGAVRDPVPMLPEGFDIYAKPFGITTSQSERLYDVVMPKVPLPDKTPPSKEAGAQVCRNYCSPPFDPDLTYGYRSFVDSSGNCARACVTDKRRILGTAGRSIVNTIQANILEATQPRLGTVLAPNDNLKDVPKGYPFGILYPPDHLPECLTFCEINKGLYFFRDCLKHLNTLRKGLSKRFLPNFFHTFYRNLKYYDKEKTGWLDKAVVYGYCGTKLIRFDPALIEPLLSMWRAFDGSKIEYKTFVHILNYREPSPEIPKIPDLPADCLDFRTTYTEMVKPGQIADPRPMAGLPSGRYLDLDYPITPERCVRADRNSLPHESDMKSCINPSVMTMLFVSQRDMYAKREPDVVRRVFEAAGDKFTDKRFDAIWEEAKKCHSQGWVCFETFRQTLEKHPNVNEFEEENTK